VCLTVVYRPLGRTCNGDLSEAPLSIADDYLAQERLKIKFLAG